MILELDKINVLPDGARVAIYGAGEYGKKLYKMIQKKRPDIKVVCFFDGKATGKAEDIEIYSIEDVKQYSNIFDFVLIASLSNSSTMSAVLDFLGIENHFIVKGFKKLKKKSYLNENIKYKEVRKKLNSKESKKVYELIVKGFLCKHCFENLSKYLKRESIKSGSNTKEQYFDFINKKAINTVISGGVYDGGNTIQFLNRLPNIEKIYGFEPMYNNFKVDLQDKIINQSKKVEIIEKGLFETSTEVPFMKFKGGSGSRIHGQNNGNSNTIEVISIDDFVNDKKIKKLDFIKMDIEGSELSALKGAEKTILKDRPQMAISIYHSYNELFDIPLYLYDLLENYKYEVYHYNWNNKYESILYAIPDELYLY